MSIHAGTILHVGGKHVIDRLQEAGLGNVQVAFDTVREVGNRLVVDKVPQEPDFTFTLNATDVSCDMMAFLLGKSGGLASGSETASGDPDGTVYDFTQCQMVNIVSPWKDPATGSAGTIQAGHIVPGYYPTSIKYTYGVTANATEEVQLQGAAFYYFESAPVEEEITASGGQTNFQTAEIPVKYRVGGNQGSTFKYVFGVLKNGILQNEGVDYNVTPGISGDGAQQTIQFVSGLTAGDLVKFCYFTTTPKSYPQTVHTNNLVKPGAVRGRNILVFLGSGSSRSRVGGIQTADLMASITGEIDRELGSQDPTGRTINGTDVNGDIVIRSRDKESFYAVLSKVTGVPRGEVQGWLNTNQVPLTIQIQNPKNPGQIIKTLYVSDAIIQPPGTDAKVNTATDFTFHYESATGFYQEIKGSFLP